MQKYHRSNLQLIEIILLSLDAFECGRYMFTTRVLRGNTDEDIILCTMVPRGGATVLRRIRIIARVTVGSTR